MNILEVRKEWEEKFRRLKNPDEDMKQRLANIKKILSTNEGRAAVAKAWAEASMLTNLTPEERKEAHARSQWENAFLLEYLADSQGAALGVGSKTKSWFDDSEI